MLMSDDDRQMNEWANHEIQLFIRAALCARQYIGKVAYYNGYFDRL